MLNRPNVPPKANFEKDTCMNFFGLGAFTVLKFCSILLEVHWGVHWMYFPGTHFAIEFDYLIRTGDAARHSQPARQAVRLLLSFSPFPVLIQKEIPVDE